jgi:hypothetical protein
VTIYEVSIRGTSVRISRVADVDLRFGIYVFILLDIISCN